MNRHEQQIVRILANSVRVMTLDQIASTWWTDTPWGRHRAAAAMHQLAAEGWVDARRVLARPIESFLTPLIVWRPRHRRPDFRAAARRLHRRAMVDAKCVKVVLAARRAVTFFGSGRAGREADADDS